MTCEKCGFDHSLKGFEIADGVLFRTASAAHRVKLFGGAWAFAACIWDAHRAEIERVELRERESGIVFHVSAADFDKHAIRKTLSAAWGAQVILPLSRWSKIDTRIGGHDGAQLAESAEDDADAVRPILVQQGLFDDRLSRIVFRPARTPRPRRPQPRRKRWNP